MAVPNDAWRKCSLECKLDKPCITLVRALYIFSYSFSSFIVTNYFVEILCSSCIYVVSRDYEYV